MEPVISGTSWFTVIALVPFCLLRDSAEPSLPSWVQEWAIPVLTSAAVG
jgi:hypothetical protein